MKIFDIIFLNEERDMFEGFNEMSLDEEYPKDFDINEFKNIFSYAGKMKYAKLHLGTPIGNGSSRVVYRVDETKVLKLAKNKKGLAQNGAETQWWNDSYYSGIIANVIDFDDENGLWVEMELARKPKKSDFKRLWGINFQEMYYYLKNTETQNKGKRAIFGLDDDVKNMMDEHENIGLLVSFMFDADSPSGDLASISSWGLVNRDGDEELVLIDFGLTSNIYDSYYK